MNYDEQLIADMDRMFEEMEWECEICGDLIPTGISECSCDYDEGYDDDGQPDEAQEWYDFDPDC
jgi:hypothetical protein